MNIFKREKTAIATADDQGYIPASTMAANSATSDDIQQARDSVDFIANELKSSAEQQQIAARKMASLNKTISKMESGLRHLQRVETDNVKFSNELSGLRKKLEQKTSWASEMENKFVNLERQHNELRQQYEVAKADIAQRKDREVNEHEKLTKHVREIESLTGQVNQKEERLATLALTHQNLQDEVAEQAGRLSAQSHNIMELQKSLEEMASKLDSKTKDGDSAAIELKNLRLDFNEMKAKYFEASGALENAKYDLKTQKNVYEDTLKRRDDETLALKSRIDQLNTQVRIKDNMSTHFDEEITVLRNTLESERERNDRNESRLRDKSEEVERNARALARAKLEYENLNAKFETALEDVETLRKINMVQKQKLERYAAIGGVTVGQSLINTDAQHPEMEEKKASRAANKKNDGPLLKAVK